MPPLSSGATFQEGKNYRVAIQIKAKSGSEFPVDQQGNPSVYCRVNGYDAEVYAIEGKDPAQYAQVEFDFGQCNDSIIEQIAITGIAPPVPGEYPSYTAAVQCSGYRINTDENAYRDAYWVGEKWYYVKNSVSWWDVTDGDYDYVYENEVFLPGHEYRCEVYVVAEDGYEFVMDLYTDPETWPTVTVNGNPGELTFHSMSGLNWYQEVAYTLPVEPATITKVTVSDLDTPVAGSAPDYTATVENPYLYEMDAESGYEASGIWWYDENGQKVLPGDSFRAGQTYHVQLRLAAAKLDGGKWLGQFVNEIMVELTGFRVDQVQIWEHVIVIDAYYTCTAETVQGGAVYGSIDAADSYEPVTIELYRQGESEPAYTEYARDTYSLTGIPKGRYTMTVSKKKHVSRSYDLEVADGKRNVDVKLCLIGDVDGNGKLNVGDVAKLYAHVKKTSPITDEYALLCADVSGDGKLNVGDTAKLYAHVKKTSLLW